MSDAIFATKPQKKTRRYASLLILVLDSLSSLSSDTELFGSSLISQFGSSVAADRFPATLFETLDAPERGTPARIHVPAALADAFAAANAAAIERVAPSDR